MSFTFGAAAQELITSEPECQSRAPRSPRIICEPGCVHEQLAAKKATVYALLEVTSYLDTIAAHLQDIAAHQ